MQRGAGTLAAESETSFMIALTLQPGWQTKEKGAAVK